jgi:multiple sugar transport system ATP-binding protein
MARVILNELSKAFGDVVAVDRVSLEIGHGELMVLVGPSGCGKTTLLRLISGLEEVSQGEIWVDDKRVNDLPPKDRDIAMVFQNYALYPHMSVYENIAFGLKLRRFSKQEIDARVQKTAMLLNISDKLQSRPGELSGGQRQRVAVGRAIIREPKVFLFDEPLSNLDAQLRVHMRAELQSLHRKLQTTTIYVTHDQVEAMTLGQRVAVLRNGVLQQVDTPQRLYQHPVNIFVAGFIGSPAMNFLEAEISAKQENILIQGAEFSFALPRERASYFPHLADYLGRKVLLGLRPEDMRTQFVDQARSQVSFEMQVEIVELLGSETVVHGHLGTQKLVARIEPSHEIKADESIQLFANAQKIHLFDCETQRSLAALP